MYRIVIAFSAHPKHNMYMCAIKFILSIQNFHLCDKSDQLRRSTSSQCIDSCLHSHRKVSTCFLDHSQKLSSPPPLIFVIQQFFYIIIQYFLLSYKSCSRPWLLICGDCLNVKHFAINIYNYLHGYNRKIPRTQVHMITVWFKVLLPKSTKFCNKSARSLFSLHEFPLLLNRIFSPLFWLRVADLNVLPDIGKVTTRRDAAFSPFAGPGSNIFPLKEKSCIYQFP